MPGNEKERKLTSDVIAISSCTSTSTVNVGSELMELLTVLVSYSRASSGTSIGSKADTTLQKH